MEYKIFFKGGIIMLLFCGYCSEELEDGVCPQCGADFRNVCNTIARDAVEVVLSRQEAVNVFILAAASRLEETDDGLDLEAAVSAMTELLSEIRVTDDTILELLDYIDETEGCQCDEEFDYCDGECDECDEECLCNGCPYFDECDGEECYFDDEDFLAVIVSEEEKEE